MRLSIAELVYVSTVVFLIDHYLPVIYALPSYAYHILLNLPIVFFAVAVVWENRGKLVRQCVSLFLLISLFNITYTIAITKSMDVSELVRKNIYMMYFWHPVFLMLYYSSEPYDRYLPAIRKWIIACLLLTSITTFIGGINHAFVVRLMASETRVEYFRENIAGYSFIYALDIIQLYFAVMISRKNKPIKRIFYIACFFVFEVCIISAQYTTALILSIPAIALIFSGSTKKILRKTILTVIILSIGMAMIMTYSKDIVRLAYNIGQTEFARKLSIVVNLLSSQSENIGDVTNRISLTGNSLNAFYNNIMVGEMFSPISTVGEHASTFDLLGRCGLLGFVLIMTIFSKYMRYYHSWRKHSRQSVRLEYLGMFMFIVISCLNPTLGFEELSFAMCLIPCVLSERPIHKNV